METRKEQKERRRQEIIFAALELFVSKGYASTKVADIAKRVNMSTGLLFHYFESKEKLYEELVRIGLEGTNYPKEQKCDHAIDYFSQFTTQLFEYMRQQPMVAKIFVLMAEAQRNESTPIYIREIAMKVETIEQFVPIIEWGQKEGTIREGNPRVISNAFWCSLQGIVEGYAVNQEIGLPDADWIVDIVRKRKG
jgi:AcrR family transcriptional regulator